MFEKLINIIYPKTCPICGCLLEKNHLICNECQKEITVIKEPRCQKCGKMLMSGEQIFCKDCKKQIHYFDKGVAVFVYHGKIKESIERFKFHNIREYTDFYAEAAGRFYGEIIRGWNIDVMIPIPIHKTKEIKRGYNQALVFAKSFGNRMEIPVDDSILKRIKSTQAQKGLTRENRYRNLKDAFAVNRDMCKTIANVLLIDDIYTTGSTMDICAELLKMAGIKKVYFLCIASGLGEENV